MDDAKIIEVQAPNESAMLTVATGASGGLGGNGSSLMPPAASPARQRRKSPVTVQEWVASLPPPHVLQRRELAAVPDHHRLDDENDGTGTFAISTAVAAPDGKENDPSSDHASAERRGVGPEASSGDVDKSVVVGRLQQQQRGAKKRQQSFDITEDDDNLRLGAEAEDDFEKGRGAAAGASINVSIVSAASSPCDGVSTAAMKRGAGGDGGHNGIAAVTQKEQDAAAGLGSALEAKRRLFLRSHDQPSFQSDISAKTAASSVDSVLFSREVDPAELLMDLGFGGASTDRLARIPLRFFKPSKARGISVEEFLRKQEEVIERFDSGFDGYRGLNGSSSSGRPSEIVEKIIQKISSQEKTMKRQFSQMSFFSHWGSVSNCGSVATTGGASLPSNHPWQEIINRQQMAAATAASSEPRFNWAKVVGRAQLQRRMEKARGAKAGLLLEQSQLAPGLKEGGAGPAGRGVAVAGAALGQARFRAAAFSVLSPANRQFMEAQEAAAAEGPKEDRKIILGGETFKVTEDLKVIAEEDEAATEDNGGGLEKTAPESPSPPRAPPLSLRPPLRRTPSLSKRESLMSINSSCSVDSDWSDEELEELEKILGDIQERSDAADAVTSGEDPLERRERAVQRWNKVRKSMKARSSTGSTADLEADDLDLEDGDDLDQEVAAASALFRRRHHASSSPSSGTSSSSNYHRSGAGSSLESQGSFGSFSSRRFPPHYYQQHRFVDPRSQGDHRVPRRFAPRQ